MENLADTNKLVEVNDSDWLKLKNINSEKTIHYSYVFITQSKSRYQRNNLISPQKTLKRKEDFGNSKEIVSKDEKTQENIDGQV